MTGPAADEFRSTFTSTAGGVMTEEAGAVTGELELLCQPEIEGLHVAVRYTGTDDWFAVSGSPVRIQGSPDDAMGWVVGHLSTPGPVVDGNEKPVTLVGFPGA